MSPTVGSQRLSRAPRCTGTSAHFSSAMSPRTTTAGVRVPKPCRGGRPGPDQRARDPPSSHSITSSRACRSQSPHRGKIRRALSRQRASKIVAGVPITIVLSEGGGGAAGTATAGRSRPCRDPPGGHSRTTRPSRRAGENQSAEDVGSWPFGTVPTQHGRAASRSRSRAAAAVDDEAFYLGANLYQGGPRSSA